jgi:NADH-quinone oxidoreductase subunit E
MRQLTREQVLKIMERYSNHPQQLIAILLDIQEAAGNNCVERQWAELASEVLNVPLSKIYDILTFYAMFSSEPRGEYVIEICRSTPCYFSRACNDDSGAACGTQKVVQWFENALGIKMGETSADGKFTLTFTNCVGVCDIGPVAVIKDDVFGNLTQEKIKTLVNLCRERKTQELLALCQN